ncbi:hypothetical protein TB2_012833 [Malus domestica]
MFTAGEATAAEAVEEEEAFRFLLTSPSGKQQKKKLGPSGGSMAGEKDLNLQKADCFGECVSFKCQCAVAMVELGFAEETTRFSVRGEGKSEEEVTDNEQAESWFSFDIHPAHMWWELRGYADGTLSRKSEMPKKIKRRPMT